MITKPRRKLTVWLQPVCTHPSSEKRLTGKGIITSKRVKHNRIYGPIKEQKCDCKGGGGHEAGPTTAFCWLLQVQEVSHERGGELWWLSTPGGCWERAKVVNKRSCVRLLVGAIRRSGEKARSVVANDPNGCCKLLFATPETSGPAVLDCICFLVRH